MTIVPMNSETVRAAAALEKTCFSTPWSLSSMEKELENPWAIWLTALEGDRLWGYLGVEYGPDGGDIMTIAVDPARRNRGVARALLEEMFSLLKEKKRRWLTLEVRPSNAPAMALYASLGFRPVGRRPRYYENPREDALLLTKFFEEEARSC